MRNKVAKAYAISDAKIMYVSLVDKAANKRQFLITKADGGKADFQTFGRILKADAESHFVTGIVYEPMQEDTQGNYMTEAEVTKAAYWFNKNGNGNDLQHNFEPLAGANVVENWVAKADFDINGQPVKKGSWLMTVEITDPDIFEAIQKGDITGFSMGGTGVYSTEDVDISEPEPVEKQRKGIFKQLAGLFGMDVVEKGEVRERYKRNSIRDNFWTAYYALSDYLLDAYNPVTGNWEIQTDEQIIRDALQDFSDIIMELLTGNVKETLNEGSVEKAGKAMSNANVKTLKSIHDSLRDFLDKFMDKEEDEVTKAEIESTVMEAVQKAMSQTAQNAPQTGQKPEGEVVTNNGVQKDANGSGEATTAYTQDTIDEMVAKAIEKATQPKAVSPEDVEAMIEKAVAKAMEPVMKSAGLPTNLNNEVKKDTGTAHHYMEGIL